MGYATVPTIVQITAAAERWVAIYARISKDRNGRAENVEIQVKLATEYAKARWPGGRVEVYCDNDLSAADPDTFRPDYHRLLGDIAAGHVCQIVSADQERLTRQITEWEALIPLLRAAGMDGTYGYRDGFTSVRPGETAASRFKNVMGAEYVEGLKVKLHEKLASNAAKGIPHGGRHYGYGRGLRPNGDKTLIVDDTEAGWLRWIADQILNEDRSVTDVADELNDQGVPTGFVWALGTKKREQERRDAGLEPEERVAARWSSGSVVGVLTNLTVAGRRQHRGEEFGAGNWEPIFDPETHSMLRAKLIRSRTSPRHARRKYELSGIVFCAECQTKMTGQVNDRRDGPRCQYRCRGCFKSNINGDALEDYIETKLLERLDVLIELRRGDDTARERRKAIHKELAELVERRALIGDMVAVGDMDRVAAVRGKAKLDEIQHRLSQELASLPPTDELPDPDAVRNAWDYLTVDERRSLIADYIERIEVTKPKMTARRTDLSRISIHGPGWEGDQTPPPPGALAAAWRPKAADLTDDEWAVVAELVKPPRRAERGRGNLKRQPLKHSVRSIVNAALYRETTGCMWHDLPDRFPPHRTVARYHQEWITAGVWPALSARLQAHTQGEPIPPAPTIGAPAWRSLPSDVTDTEWATVAELVQPPGSGRVGQRGRPFKYDMRQVLDAVLYREATGCTWPDLPDRYPPHHVAARFYNQWRNDGTWEQVRQQLQTTTPQLAVLR